MNSSSHTDITLIFNIITHLKMSVFDGTTLRTIWVTGMINHHWNKSNTQDGATSTSIASISSWRRNAEARSRHSWTADRRVLVQVLPPHTHSQVISRLFRLDRPQSATPAGHTRVLTGRSFDTDVLGFERLSAAARAGDRRRMESEWCWRGVAGERGRRQVKKK